MAVIDYLNGYAMYMIREFFGLFDPISQEEVEEKASVEEVAVDNTFIPFQCVGALSLNPNADKAVAMDIKQAWNNYSNASTFKLACTISPELGKISTVNDEINADYCVFALDSSDEVVGEIKFYRDLNRGRSKDKNVESVFAENFGIIALGR